MARERLKTVEAPAAVILCRATQQAAYEALLADDRIVFQADEPAGLESWWKKFAVCGTASPKLWMDAYLAAFALAGRHRMVATDAAFRQFQGLELLVLV